MIRCQPVFYEPSDPPGLLCRPVVLYSEDDWEKEQKVYVDSVTRHMKNNAENGKAKKKKKGLLL